MFVGDLRRFVGGLHQLHAALRGVGLDRALAATAGMDLGLHHGELAAEFVERVGGFFATAGDDALGHGDRRPRGGVPWPDIREFSWRSYIGATIASRRVHPAGTSPAAREEIMAKRRV